MALDSRNELAWHTMPDANCTILTSTQDETLIKPTEGRPQDVVALFVTTVLSSVLSWRQVPAFDTRLCHGDIGKQVLPVLAQVYSSDCVVTFDNSHVWTCHVFIILLINDHWVNIIVDLLCGITLHIIFIVHFRVFWLTCCGDCCIEWVAIRLRLIDRNEGRAFECHIDAVLGTNSA